MWLCDSFWFCLYDNNVNELILIVFTVALSRCLLQHLINISQFFMFSDRKVCLSPYYNGSNSYLFVNNTKIYQYIDSEKSIACV